MSGRAYHEWVHGTVANLASLLQEDHAEWLVRVHALLRELEIARLEDDERQLHLGKQDDRLEGKQS